MSPSPDYRRLLAEGFAEEAGRYLGRPVRTDLPGERWPSVWAAHLSLGVRRKSIYRAISTGRRLAGRLWHYAGTEPPRDPGRRDYRSRCPKRAYVYGIAPADAA